MFFPVTDFVFDHLSTVQKKILGESITLPDASYEGHYLESWIQVVENGNVHTFLAVGPAGSEFTPERSLNLYANWKPNQEQDIIVTYEAKIGDTGYERLV